VPYRTTIIGSIIGLTISLFLFSCEKKNEKAVILLSPLNLYIPAKTSEVVVIDVTCHSPFELKQLLIKSRIEGDYFFTELDSSISGKNFYLQYEYRVPELNDTSNVFLEFFLFDESNEKVSNFRVIIATPEAVFLTETAGHIVYSGNSGEQNGYDLVLGSPRFLHLADSAKIHIADTTNSETLLKRWISPAGVRFVKFNGFDYANSTNLSAKNAFSSGVKYELLNSIEAGDIYITEIKTSDNRLIYPVIKIVDVIDQPGSASDRYVFNLKK